MMYFSPFVIQADTGKPIEVIVDAAETDDLEATHGRSRMADRLDF